MVRFWVNKTRKSAVWISVLAILVAAVLLLNFRAVQTQEATITRWNQAIAGDAARIGQTIENLRALNKAMPTKANQRALDQVFAISDGLDAQSASLDKLNGETYMKAVIETYRASGVYQRSAGVWLLAEPQAMLKPKVAIYQQKVRRHELLEPLDASTLFPNNLLMVLRVLFSGMGALAATTLLTLDLLLDRTRPDRTVWVLGAQRRWQLVPFQLMTVVGLLGAGLLVTVGTCWAAGHLFGHPFLIGSLGRTGWHVRFAEVPQPLVTLVLGRGVGFVSFSLLLASLLQLVLWRAFRPYLMAGLLGAAVAGWTLVTLLITALQQAWNPAAWLITVPGLPVLGVSLLVSAGLATLLGTRFAQGKAVL
ncbi:hypothetical protein [Lacticaseibacillus absianus]|uniref:hypothetical protein n=1 Tax=Lacticaseibacillus absianus TaxID=2729623 RepID=UPI0015CD5202|nr:hypothetical protein [Lacticaseibacillus absianus]